MKQYIITYEFYGEPHKNVYNTVFELSQRLDELLQDGYVIDDTISIHTEDNAVESLVQPLFYESTEDFNERMKQ